MVINPRGDLYAFVVDFRFYHSLNSVLCSSLLSQNRFEYWRKQVSNTLKLLSEGSTIPFISRYRKEMTGSLDEVQIQNIEEQYDKLSTLQKRKEFILSSIGEEGKLIARTPKENREFMVGNRVGRFVFAL